MLICSVNLASVENTLLTGKRNGANAAIIKDKFDAVTIKVRPDQLVTSSFFYGVLYRAMVKNIYLDVNLVDANPKTIAELKRARKVLAYNITNRSFFRKWWDSL